MKEELENKLIESLDYIGGLVKSGVDLTKAEAPIVIKELLTYRFIQNVVSASVSFIILAISSYIAYHCYKFVPPEPVNRYASDPVMPTVGLIVGSIAAAISFLCSVCSINECVQIKFAPRVYFMEYLSNLNKKD